MLDKSSEQINLDQNKKSAIPASSYWTMEREADGRLSTYQFSSPVESIAGFKADYFEGGIKQWLGVVHPEDRQKVFDYLSKLMDTESEVVIEYRLIRPDGLVRWVSDCAISVRLPGNIMRVDGVVSDITERKQAEEILKHSNQKLASWINELQERKNKMDLLENISSALQPCTRLEEVSDVLVKHVEDIFPNQPGALYLFDVNASRLQQLVTWGGYQAAADWTPESCHAWQNGKPHVAHGNNRHLLCKHDQPQAQDELLYLCAPLVAQGERVGVLYLWRKENDFAESEQYDSIDFWKSMAMMIAERLAYVLLNLKLRSDLANQSVRDSLTGLYIRRYLEEALQHEIARATRYKRSFGLMLIDIDHLSTINETVGYAAGNAVLQAFGKFFLNQIRSTDVGCRYGEDEIIVLLSEASLEDTARRAEVFRMGGKNQRIMFEGQLLKPVTLTIGVTAFNKQNEMPQDLLNRIEKALAEAKAGGGDQVVTQI